MPTGRELALLALMGFSIWLAGAVMFRFGGQLMFESGPVWLAATTISIAFGVCLLLKTIMDWRKLTPAQSAVVAIAMGLPGLFGDFVLILNLNALTGLRPETAGPVAGVVLFGNAAMLGYALWRTRRATA